MDAAGRTRKAVRPGLLRAHDVRDMSLMRLASIVPPVRSRRSAAVALCVLAGLLAIVGSGGGSDSSLPGCRASVSTDRDPNGYGDGDGPGDGGTGAGEGGPGLGRFRNAIVRVEQADGTVVGEAQVDDTDGVVQFVLCGYDGPVQLQVRGRSDGSTQYYDESTRTFAPFPATATMHAVVPKFEKNIGITILTEAAWQYLQARYGASGWRTAANVREANLVIRDEFNRYLPAALQIEDITRLPELLGDTTQTGSVPATANGVYGIVNSGLARAAGLLRTGDTQAALTIARQMGTDLCDGLLDGRCNGTPVANDSSELSYLVPQLGEFLGAGVGDIAANCGDGVLEAGSLRIVQVKVVGTFTLAGGFTVNDRTPIFLLRNDGRVFFWAKRSIAPVAYAPALRFRQLFTSGPLLGTATDGRSYRAPLTTDPASVPPNDVFATALPPVEVTAYAGVSSLAEIDESFSSRFAQVSRFADGRAYVESGASSFTAPAPVDVGLGDITRLGVARGGAGSPGYFAVTRAGNLFSWGDNAGGQLGLGFTYTELPQQPAPALVRFASNPAIVSVSGRISGAFALDRDGAVWGWGATMSEGLSQPATTVPVKLSVFDGRGPVRQIECAAFSACGALTATGDFLVWGPGSQASPWPAGLQRVALPTGRKAVYIGAAGLMVYGLLDDGAVVLLPTLPSTPDIRNASALLPKTDDANCSGPR